MHLCDVPEEIETLLDRLSARGFRRVDERLVDGVNGEFVMTDGVTRVSVRCDRCDWDVSIGITGGFRHPDIWEAYLGGREMSGEPSEDLAHQVRFLINHLDDIEAVATPEVEAELARMDRDFMRRYFGLDP